MINLDEIKARHKAESKEPYNPYDTHYKDIDALIAEVERLQEENKQLNLKLGLFKTMSDVGKKAKGELQ